jgi:hypothetical protein
MKYLRRPSCRSVALSTVAIALGVCLQPAVAAPESATQPASVTPSVTPAVPAVQPVPQPTGSPVSQQDITPTSANEIAILTPLPGAVLDQPSTSVTIQYPVGARVDVLVNDQAADRGLIGRTETNQTTGRVTETWYGIILNQGKNAISLHRAGDTKPSAQIEVQVSGQPTKIKVSTLETKIPADGRSAATIQGELQDEAGHLSNWSADVTLESSAGEFIGTDQAPDSPGFQVKVNRGRFTALLRSSSQAQAVRVRAQTSNLEGYYQFQFETPVRKSLLSTGVIDIRLGARGTNFYDRFQNFLPTDRNNDAVLNAFYRSV